ncbi:MAG: hypothetical protein ACI9Z4_000367 [Polaribacter sp.]
MLIDEKTQAGAKYFALDRIKRSDFIKSNGNF